MKRYKYIGRGHWYPGVPARDLTQADLDRLSEDQLAAVQSGKLYKPARRRGPDRRHTERDDELDLVSAINDEETN